LSKINIINLRDDIRDIYLDPCELDIRAETVDDGSGRKYVDYEITSSNIQDLRALTLLKEAITAEVKDVLEELLKSI